MSGASAVTVRMVWRIQSPEFHPRRCRQPVSSCVWRFYVGETGQAIASDAAVEPSRGGSHRRHARTPNVKRVLYAILSSAVRDSQGSMRIHASPCCRRGVQFNAIVPE
ncbi:hypothetical protein B0H12DRAFT_300640 [Mycena haematopus]|nr:hypothetical protein B0H12DRAFT_300640 [Mycena haematopus]